MFFTDLVKISKEAFKIESETQLCYFFSKKKFIKEHKSKTYFKGFFLRSLIFFYTICQNCKFFSKKVKPKYFYIYANQLNDFISLKPFVDNLIIKKKSFHLELNTNFIIKKKLDLPKNSYQSFFISPKLAIVSLLLFFIRGFKIYQKTKKNKLMISSFFNIFCESYMYLPFFLENLSKVKPYLVILSNDHSVCYRALRLAAEILKIKTLYIQHASVTDQFPSLAFDYALLDGKYSYQTYLKCYKIQKKNRLIKNKIKKCFIYLSGQKKLVKITKLKKTTHKVVIGLATGNIDNLNYVKLILKNILDLGLKCFLRFHPTQSPEFIKKLSSYCKNKELVNISYKQEPLADYFSNVDAIIASQSSIHLEAAIAGLPTFFIDMYKPHRKFDGYGYVKKGLAFRLNKNFNNLQLPNLIKKSQSLKRKLIIKNFSETFNTPWQNREGDLALKTIENFQNRKFLSKYYKKIKSCHHSEVFGLKYND